VGIRRREGTEVVVKAGRVFGVVAVDPLGEPVLASPAVAGGRLYFRGRDHLDAIGTK
jgi:hypothetical protein